MVSKSHDELCYKRNKTLGEINQLWDGNSNSVIDYFSIPACPQVSYSLQNEYICIEFFKNLFFPSHIEI